VAGCRSSRGGDVGEPLKEAVESGLTILDRGLLVLGERYGGVHLLQVGFGFQELGLGGVLGGVEVAALIFAWNCVDCGERWPSQACSSNRVIGSLALWSWLAIVERAR
jgi:hypothetical protein